MIMTGPFNEVILMRAIDVERGAILASGVLDGWEVVWIERPSHISERLMIGALAPDDNSGHATLTLGRYAQVPVYGKQVTSSPPPETTTDVRNRERRQKRIDAIINRAHVIRNETGTKAIQDVISLFQDLASIVRSEP